MSFSGLLQFLIPSAAVGAVLLALLRRVLPENFASATFSHRSSHRNPARQIGGLAVVPPMLLLLVVFGRSAGLDTRFIACVGGAALILLVTGYVDDRSHMPVGMRIVAQLVACVIAVFGLGPDFHLVSTILPRAVEIPLLILALMWFINLTNFMDGLDLMVVSGLGLPLLAVTIFAIFGLVSPGTGAFAALLAGALAGFGVFNFPPARIFLGDAGSLPIGLLAGIAFFEVAFDTHLTVGFMLPLYFSADATVTVVMRLFAGEQIFTAHSHHAYQVARRNGWSVPRIIGRVSVLNVFIALSAMAGAMTSGMLVTDLAFLAAAAATGFALWRFRRAGQPRHAQLPR